jgi:hypothetical protein
MGFVLRDKTGKCNRESWGGGPERAPLQAKMAPKRMLGLTLPCAQVAQAELRTCLERVQVCSGMLTLGSG